MEEQGSSRTADQASQTDSGTNSMRLIS